MIHTVLVAVEWLGHIAVCFNFSCTNKELNVSSRYQQNSILINY